VAVVLITGSSSGIGQSTALAFARAGDTVYASMRNLGRGEELAQRARAESLDIRLETLDVTDAESFAPLIDSIVRKSGRLDVLVNNAGVLHAGALEDLAPAQLRDVVEANLLAPLLLTRAVLPQMRKQRSGHVLMVSSLSGVAGLPGDVAYTASKFGLEGATEALRHEVDRWGIHVALVQPALYATNLFTTSTDGVLPADYPADSAYRALIEHRQRELHAKLPQGRDPSIVADLLVRISRSDGKQLRWPADEVAVMVLRKLFAMDDAERDQFLRDVSGTHWWSEGRDAPDDRAPTL
jgi:NAD(P)-dependent dehydrogenase (short-subunit alcohol dehydrogenase family)